MTTARTMTERELDGAAEEIACELLLIAFAIHGRTRPALAAVYAAVACSDAFAIHGRTRPALAAVYAAVACSDAFESDPPGLSGRPEEAGSEGRH